MATTVEVGKNAELLWNDLDFTFADDRANATFGGLEAFSYYIKCEETLLISSNVKYNLLLSKYSKYILLVFIKSPKVIIT